MEQSKKVPVLRFPEFLGEWEEKTIGSLCATFKSGSGITSEKISDKGKYPVYGGNGLRGYTNTFTHDGFFILIGRQGALCGNINRSTGKSYISEHAIAVNENEFSNTEWLAQRLDYLNLNRFSESSAQAGLAVNKLIKFKILVPSRLEQTKIADFLTQIDNKISQLSQKKQLLERYKKGVMQQIFSQSIGFTDDYGRDFPEWEVKKLGEITKKISDNRNKKLSDAKVYSVTNSNGFVLQSEHFDRVVAGNDLSNYKIIQKSEFAYNPARINVGSIAYFQDDIGIISSLYVCFKTTDKLLDKFLLSILELDYTKFQIENLGEGGVRVYLWYDLFALIKCKIPCIEEQTKIANFLTALDNKIALVESQLNGTKQYKKGLLQQLFV
jgi:type I restriction enzyme S subunit